MKHRIYTRAPLDGRIAITGDELHHAARVARVHENEEVELFDGEGHAASGVVESIGRDELIVRVDHAIDARESPVAIDLARHRSCSFEQLGPRRLRAETAAIVACAVVASRALST